MVKVNNKIINILPRDTEAVFILNIANVLKTLPRYLHFKEKIDLDQYKINQNKVIQVDNLLDLINDYSDDYNFDKFYSEVKDKFNNIDEIVKLWVINNTAILSNPIFMLKPQNDLDELFGKQKFNIDKILSEKKEIENKLQNEIKLIKDKVNQQNEISEKLNKLKSKESSAFEIEKITLQVITNINNLSLSHIFDSIKTNKNVPFCSYKNYYKIYEDFKPLESFIGNFDDIFCKILSSKSSFKTNLEKDYEDALIYLQDGNRLVIETKTNLKFLTEEEIIKRLFSIFQDLEVNVVEINKIKFNGIFFISNSLFNSFILSDLIMNKNYFENYLFIDESMRASKSKAGLYIHFNDPLRPELGEVKASIISKKVVEEDQEIRTKSRLLFPYGSNMIRVKVSYAINLDSVNNFINIFCRLMSLYDKDKIEVEKFYLKYIPDFEIEKQEIVKEKKDKSLKDNAPDLFISGYSKLCQIHKPSIISENRVEDYPEEKVMLFPKTPEEGKQFYYICDHEDKPYPGLIQNTLSNKDIYPYIPCCFKKDQKGKDKSLYKAYYEDLEIEEGEQQRIITTNKLSQKDKFAVIPNNMKLLFDSFDSKYDYLRKGVYRSSNSFLECVVDALDIEMPDEAKDRKEWIENERKKLLNLNLNLCKQECFDMTIEEISDYIKDVNLYFDPKLFVTLLEQQYNVNIYLFSRVFTENEGYMILPRHTQGHFYYPKDKSKTILIYEHLGNESDKSEYPQSELIVQWDMSSENFTKLFITGSKFIKGINKIYKLINGDYFILNVQNKEIDIKLKNLKSQWIDQYGKVRALELENGLKFFTSPLPPLNLKDKKLDYFLTENNFKMVKSFSDEIGLTLKYEKKDEQGMIIGGEIKNVDIAFKIQPVNLDLVNKNFNLPFNKESKLQLFENNQKIAYILSQYFLYDYSDFIYENEEELDNSSLLKFANENTIFIKDFDYKNLSNDWNNPSFYKNNKLVLENEEMLKRLIYITRKNIMQNYNQLKDYHKLNFIPNYYRDISDFKQYPLQVILKGEVRVQEYIQSSKFLNKIYNTIQTDKNNYFILINNKIYLVQKIKNVAEGVYKGIVWNKFNFIPNEIKSVKNYEYTLWVYNNYQDIIKVKRGTIVNDFDLKILVYKFRGKIVYNLIINI